MAVGRVLKARVPVSTWHRIIPLPCMIDRLVLRNMHRPQALESDV